jgi:hypothetical protein
MRPPGLRENRKEKAALVGRLPLRIVSCLRLPVNHEFLFNVVLAVLEND